MPRTRNHELAEELDECFLDFLQSQGVQGTINQRANNNARTVTFSWKEGDDAPRIDVDAFPDFLAFTDPKLFARTQRTTEL